MSRKQTLDSLAIGAMITLCAAWAFQQVAIKFAIAEVPPIWQSGIRSFGATILIGLWIVLAKKKWRSGLLGAGVAVGVLFALEFGLLYFALLHTDAARAVLLLYTAPFVVAVGAHFRIKGDRLSLAGWLGVLLAFIGTVIVMQASFALDSEQFLGDICALGAGIAWGLTTLVVRTTKLSNAAASQTLFYQLIISGFLHCLVALVFEGSFSFFAPLTIVAWSSLAFQTIGVATISYLGWFALLRRYSSTKLSVFTFLTPLFGALAGIVFLGESIDASHVMALALVICGIVIVNMYGHAQTTGAATNQQA
jgi:drug/metabolite transporter (DMT)-like permease